MSIVETSPRPGRRPRYTAPNAVLPALFLSTALLLFALVPSPATAVVWYVDIDNTSGIEDGTSWATAYTTIQPAIDAATNARAGEEWAAAGLDDQELVSLVGGWG